MNNFEWVEFGNVFTFEKGKLQSSKVDEDEEGEVLFIGKAEINENTKKIKHDEYLNGGLFIASAFNGNGKCPIRYTEEKCINSDLMLYCKINNKYINKINKKYIYYLLKSINNNIEMAYDKGSCNKSLDQKNFNRMKIPIPPLEIQNKLITKLDSSNDKVKYMKLIVDSMKQDIETFFELTIEIENRKPETKWIEFGEVFTLEKGKLQSSKVEEVENDETYEGVFINLSKSNDFKKINNTILDGENIFISNTAPLGLIQYYNGKCNYSDLLQHIKVNDIYKTKINIKYMYHFLTSINEHLKEVYDKGSCNKSLDQKNFNRMKIQIPSIKQQNKCIEKINEMEEIIKRWENDIDNILNNGSNKFLEYLEGESIKFEKDKDHKELVKKKSKTIDI